LGLTTVASVALGITLMVALVWGRPLTQAFTLGMGIRRRDTKTPLKNALCGVKATGVIGDLITVSAARALAESCSTKTQRYTINDVLCAMVGGAFRRYFRELGYKPDKMTCRCVIPVNIRSPKEEVRAENKFTLIFASLPVHLEKSKDRIRYMHDRMTDLKNGFEPLLGITFIHGLSLLPQSLMEAWVNVFTRRSSMVITNVDVREKPMRFSGVLVRDIFGWVPAAGGIGVGVSLVSYMGKLNVGLIADKNQVPNLNHLADCFREEWSAVTKELCPPQKSVS
jgi:hypothetical protein